MATLTDTVKASAAKRLSLPPNARPAGELARYKNFLKVETHRLKIRHRAGVGGLEICQARALMIDLLEGYIFEAIRQGLGGPRAMRLALVAVGGYGRGELNPHSDIDVLLLHDGDSVMVARGKLDPFLEALTGPGGLIYTLNDIGLKVGHATRNIEECVRSANANMQSKTSLIEARWIAGDQGLFDRMQQVVLARCVMGRESEYIAARLEDQATRRAKFGNSACMQEPNVKNGCGGLRDFQNLLWMAFFKYRVHSVKDLEAHQQVSALERRQLESAYDYLLRARNELHYQTNRAWDVLTKALQPAVAYALGYTDRSPVVRIELFMRDYYTHTRNIYLLTRTLEKRLALRPARPHPLSSLRNLIPVRRIRAPEPVDGFRFEESEILAGSQRVFRDQPRRLMRVFLHAQQRGLQLHPELAQLIRRDLALVDKKFIRDAHVHQTFLEILNQRGSVARVLRLMHEVGFLGKYVPEFGDLTCLVQHEFYHQYTADEHTLMCLEKLDQIWGAQQPPFSHYTAIFQGLERPFVLYLALLLHDAGKAHPASKHEELGGRLALRVARRLGIEPAIAQTLQLLIENHLVMIQTSQRHDLDDPAVIRSFAARIQTPENLALLMLHTFADSQGTSDQLWNDFKEMLLWTLYQKTRQILVAGTEFRQAEARQREALFQEVLPLMPGTFGEDELRAHFTEMPARYFQIHAPEHVVADLALAHRFMHVQMSLQHHGLEPVIDWHQEPDRGYTAVKICTWNRKGLFSKIAGSLTAAGLNILSAQIFSRNDSIILDTFFVNDARTGKLPARESHEQFEAVLRQALTSEANLDKRIAQLKPSRSLYQFPAEQRLPTLIRFDNTRSDTRTVIEVETEDRLGLLYVISRALAGLGLDISLAKITTEKGAAIDTFYVTERDEGKVTSAERLYDIENVLRAAVATLDQQEEAHPQ